MSASGSLSPVRHLSGSKHLPPPSPTNSIKSNSAFSTKGRRGRRRPPSVTSVSSRMSRAGTAASSSEFGYNDGESVNVVLRVRPLLAHETSRGDRCSVFVDSKGTGVTLDMGESGEGSSQQHFTFNQCFDSQCSQDSLFEESGIKEVRLAHVFCFNDISCIGLRNH